MTRKLSLVIAVCGLLAAADATKAQSINAPSGSDAATMPGGTEGIADARNEVEAIRSGDAIPVPPRADGIPVEERMAPSLNTIREPGAR